jgi:hypothetical protein
MSGLPCYGSDVGGGDVDGELLTPTGAALLRFFVGESGSFGPQPAMIPRRTGVGFGAKDFERCNCLRSCIGETFEGFELRGPLVSHGEGGLRAAGQSAYPAPYEARPAPAFGRVAELSCNLDDMTGEEMGFALDALLALGALDVFYTPIQMKKNRPAYLLTVLCRPEDADALAAQMFRHTTTLGVRKLVCDRYELRRSVQSIQSPYGEIRIKRSKLEYEDLARIAKEMDRPLLDVKKELES